MHVGMCAPNIHATISFKMAKLTANIIASSSAVCLHPLRTAYNTDNKKLTAANLKYIFIIFRVTYPDIVYIISIIHCATECVIPEASTVGIWHVDVIS